MNTSPVDADIRRYTRQHDRILFAVVQQLQEMNTRLQFVENALDPQVEPPSMGDFVAVDAARTASANLSEEIAHIEATLQEIVTSLDASSRRSGAHSPIRDAAIGEVDGATRSSDDTIVVDLNAPRRPKWRADAQRPNGWQPVKRKA